MTDPAAGESFVLPRRSQAWQSQNGFALLAFTAAAGAIAWYVVTGEPRVPLLLVAAGVGAYVGQVLAFKRDQDTYRLLVDAAGISSLRDGETVHSSPWSRMTAVELEGDRFGNWGVYGAPGLVQVRCRVRGTGGAAGTDVVGVALGVPAFGRRGIGELDRALREVCTARGVPYSAHWS